MGRRRGLLLGACFTLAGLAGCLSTASGEADLPGAPDGGAVVDRGADGPEFLVGDRFFEPGVVGSAPTPVSAAKGAILLKQALASPALAVTEEDPAALARLRPYLDEVAALRAKTIADVTEDLWHVNVPGAVHPSGASLPRGSAITPHQAEALLEQARGAGHPAQLALLNGGASRRDIPLGRLLGTQVYELMPYGNTLTLLELQGAQLRGALEAAVERATAAGHSGDPFPYLGGARFTVDMNAPATQRVQAVELRAEDGSWTPMDPSAAYLVATVNYLADGNDGYLLLKEAASRQNTTLVDCDCFIAYAASRGNLARLPETWRSTFRPRR